MAKAMAKTVTKDRAAAKTARCRWERLGKESSEIPDIFNI
jgi:hypothetical protein